MKKQIFKLLTFGLVFTLSSSVIFAQTIQMGTKAGTIQFKGNIVIDSSVTFPSIKSGPTTDSVLTIDNIGILSKMSISRLLTPATAKITSGLTKLPSDSIVLGGRLTSPTTITTSSVNTLSIPGLQTGGSVDELVTINSAGVLAKKTVSEIVRQSNSLVTTASDIALTGANSIVIFTGVNATFSLPSASTLPNKEFKVVNKGSGVITFSSNIKAGDNVEVRELEGLSDTNSLSFVSDGTDWIKLN